MPRLEKNPPVAPDFMEAARSFGNYNLAFSLADLIDNSISAGATHIDIRTSFEDEEIRITDDGCGMTEEELINNMRMGSRNPNAKNEKNDLGRFGLGLKTASFAQARQLTVISRKDGILTAAEWDLDNVDDWSMSVFSSEEANRLVSEKFPEGSGTEIVWRKLSRLFEGGTVSFEAFNDLMNEAEQEISLVFHRYLSGELDHRPKLTIARNNRNLIAFDPFFQANPSTQKKEVEEINFSRQGQTSKIVIKPFILPHFSQLSSDENKQLGGREGYVKNQGFYIYREHRLIIRGTWFKLVPHGEFSKLARIRVDIPNTVDIDWKISVDKSEAELPWELRLRLKNLIANWVMPDAIRPIIKRDTKVIERLQPVWNRHNSTAGVWHFSINKMHPLIATFNRRLKTLGQREEEKGLVGQFSEIVRLIEKSLPLEKIKTAMEDKSQTENAGYTDLQEILDTAVLLREALIHENRSSAEIEEILQGHWPYSEHMKEIKKYFLDNPATR